MKTVFEELESPYLDSKLEFVVPTYELSDSLESAIGRSPFTNCVAHLHETEANRPTEGMETRGGWSDEENEDTRQEYVSVEEDILDEIEPEWIDDESADYDSRNDEIELEWTDDESADYYSRNYEPGEAEREIQGEEAGAEDEAYMLADEPEQWIQGNEHIAEDEASPLGHEYGQDGIDYEDQSEVEDESPKTTPILAGFESEKANLGVTIILDQPAESDDRFQLVGGGGAYTKTLGPTDAKSLVAGENVLRFDGVNPNIIYKLIHQRSKGSNRPVFLNMPFKSLTKTGKGPREAKHTYLTFYSQAPSKLPDKWGNDQPVDEILVQSARVLVDLKVEDPEI